VRLKRAPQLIRAFSAFFWKRTSLGRCPMLK
jgi:hypothetical protein